MFFLHKTYNYYFFYLVLKSNLFVFLYIFRYSNIAGRKGRDMNKKIVFFIVVLLSLFVEVKASVLQIGGKSFIMSEDIVGNGYTYTVSNNTLLLNGYNGEHIYTDDNLNIIVKGENYLEDSNKLPLIKSKNIFIDGDGTLNLIAESSAISGTNLTIKNIKIKGNVTRELLAFTNKLSMDNVNIDVNSDGSLIFGGKDININNSVIKSSNRFGIRYDDNGNVVIMNSNIEMECSSICLYAKADMHFDNTISLFYGKTSASKNTNLIFENNTSFMTSNDGINYLESSDYNNIYYLKTFISNVDDNLDNDNNEDDSNNNDNEDNSSNDDNMDNSNNDIDSGIENELPTPDIIYSDNEYSDDIENPKTFDNINNHIIILIVSLLLICGLVLVLLRNINGEV